MQFQAEFLPPLVRELVCYNVDLETSIKPELKELSCIIDNQGLLDRRSIQQFLAEGVTEGPVNPTIQSTDLTPFKYSCSLVHTELYQLCSNRASTLSKLFADQLNWMGPISKSASEIWFDLYENGHFNQAWLVGSTVLEQLLRNIGAMKTMIGSPLTLNIRNLLWHGFIIPSDDVPLGAYGAMLISLTMTITQDIRTALKEPLMIQHQYPKSFYGEDALRSQPLDPLSHFDSDYEKVAYGQPPSLVDTKQLVDTFHQLISQSLFIAPGTKELWTEACLHLSRNNNSKFTFVISTLPLIEHALRLIYVAINHCKEDRKSALIAGEYYLTLDVILDKVVPVEFYNAQSDVLLNLQGHQRIQNKLHQDLGDSVMNLFSDLFIHGLGPRLRDRTSHGEFNYYLMTQVEQETWFGYYTGLVTFLLQKYMPKDSESVSIEVKEFLSRINQYPECRFDERSILKKEVFRCQYLLSEFVGFASKSRELISGANTTEGNTENEVMVEIIHSIDGAVVFSNIGSFSEGISFDDRMKTSLANWSMVGWREDVSADMFSSNLPAWILIVRSIHNAIEKVITKFRTQSEQLSQRQLSSRSRKQFGNMKSMIPRLFGMLIGCLGLVERHVLTWPAGMSRRNDKKMENMSISEEKANAEEIMIRLKITTFVDKFVSNFDRVKLKEIEGLWQELLKNVF
ncbi:hypothetical protein BGZ76_008137 [Entomortierella beljakovae]|nr:hypothetical protein BGZ76_008137 [Entomortierella beljakovae]